MACRSSVPRMLRGVLALILSLCWLPAVNVTVAAQQTAGFVGQVKDESGGVLPGVTVTAASPALQLKEVSAVTDGNGEYRITELPIGIYQLTYSINGFQTVKRDELRLTQGFTAKVDVALKVGAVEETITVSGASPVVDVKSTSTATVLTKETLELTPTDRNGLLSLVSQTPGTRGNLDVGGTAITTIPVISAFGQVAETWQVIDGVITTSFRSTGGQFGNYFDYEAFEEARSETVAHDAEVPRIGVMFTAVVKSGGNDFHGGASYSVVNTHLQSNNVDAGLAAQGINAPPKLESRHDGGGDLGGKIVQDKLWFYTAYRKRNNSNDILNAFQPDGSPAVKTQDQSFSTGKLSYQMTPKQRLSSYFQWATKGELANLVTPFYAWESRAQQIWYAQTGKVEWQYVPSSSVVASVRYGHFHVHSRFVGFADTPSARDLKTTRTWGDGTNDGNISQDWNYDFSGSLSWYKPQLGGSHQFKTGYDYVMGTDVTGSAGSPYDQYQLVFNGGVPTQLYTFNWPLKAFVTVHYLGIYGQDSWNIGRGVTLNLGLRYAHDNGFVPEQCRSAGMFAPASCIGQVQMNIWRTVAPRLHAAWDMTGDGKTVVKGGWGRFDHVRAHSPELTNVNPNQTTQTTWLWHDLNGDGLYQPGEVNLNPNGPDFVSIAAPGGTTLANGVPNPNEREPKIDEYSVSVERQLVPNLAVRITGLYTRTFNTYRLLNTPRPYSVWNIPITKTDPGPDGVPGTADDPGASITYYAYPSSLAGSAFSQTMLINDPNADQTYKSFELAASKRLSNHWQFNASYSATKKHIPFGSDPPFNANPNAEINTANQTWEWETKLSGAYQLPGGVTASANFQNISGNPFARQVLFTAPGTTVPSLVVNVEPIAARRLPSQNLLDLRAEKTIRLPGNQRVTARVTVFNSLNANTALTLQQQSGSTFLQPTSIIPPRVVEIGVSYAF
jgi:hypothetical protein